MTNEQLYLAIGIPSVLNIGLMALLYTVLSAKIDGVRNEMGSLRQVIDALRNEMNARFEAAHQALLRVEGVLDARLKHLEDAQR